MENEIGSLEPGKYADFAVCNTDIRKMTTLRFLLNHKLELAELDDFVDLIVTGGRKVFERQKSDRSRAGRVL